MANNTRKPEAQENLIDDLPPIEGADGPENMFAEGEGRRDDGSIGLPKITMATIRAFPSRCKEMNNGNGGRMVVAVFSGVATGTEQAVKPDTGEVFFGLKGDFGAVVYGRDGLPEAVYKSDTLYFPIGHRQALEAIDKTGRLQFAIEFSAQPANNPAGYSWVSRNLAKLDRNNLSPIDKLLALSVQTQKRLESEPSTGLLSDLRESAIIGGAHPRYIEGTAEAAAAE